jgi:rfaE bifunctional protein nucleotidyltransferase chain/domain
MSTYPAPDFERKIREPSAAARACASLPRPLVFTNGCFDILHRGHVTYLAQARGLGASLVVGVNTDDSVRRQNKGVERPLNRLEDRMALLAALDSVTLVTWFDQDTPLDLILRCRPDVLVKGGDWDGGSIVGAPEVRGWGGTVHTVPFLYDRSTTSLVQRIRDHT